MKYIIDIEDEYTKDWVNETPMCKELCIPISVPNRQRTYHVITGFKLEPYTESDREAIENEVWEFAKKVSIMKPEDKRECWGTDKYNTINFGYSYQEAKAKYDAWKEEKEEIHVGDEVFLKGDPHKEKAIVLRLYQPKMYKPVSDVLWADGSVEKTVLVEKLMRTGRHFDEVERLLERMKAE